MFETELKFQVPAGRWAALRKAVATASAVQTRLQALYVETPGHDLAAAGLALRLRKEGRVWVQTLKGRGDGLMQRLEHEVRLPPQAGLPALDPARHDGSPAGALLRQVLAAARAAGRSDELRVLYRTDIRRTHRRLRQGGALVELALDEGQIVAEPDPPSATDAGGGARAPKPLRLAVAEIEFELISGPPRALAALAARWAQRHGLWWDVRAKSERGFRLALGREQVPAVRAARQQLPAEVAEQRGAGAAPAEALANALARALAAMLNNTLAQALPNLAEIAGASSPEGAAPEHLHQFRVAVRRLRSALRLFAAWTPVPAEALTLEARWREVFTALGAARDADVLATVWQPRLLAAGAPPLAVLAPPAAPSAAPGELLRTPEVSVLLLDTLALALQLDRDPVAPVAPADVAGDNPARPARSARTVDAATAARAVLRRAWKAAWADARHFARAPVERQHRARKRLKRLRYALEFTAPWLPAKALKRWHGRLARALEALGQHNDLHAARTHYAALVQAQPEAWFALGWLAAQEATTSERAQGALDKLQATPLPWKTGKR